MQLFYLLCKRVKRGAGGVPIVDIVVVVVARSIQVVRIVSVVIVAGTQPGHLIRVIAPKVNGFYTALFILLYYIRYTPPSANPHSALRATFPFKKG